MGLTKVSILCTYLRIFTTSKTFGHLCLAVMAVVGVWTIGSTVATILQCIPVAASWDKSIRAQCTDSDVFWIAYGALQIATDLIILSLPIQPIMKLNMRRKEKFGLLLAFGLGLLYAHAGRSDSCLADIGPSVVLTSILRVVAVSASTQNKADATC